MYSCNCNVNKIILHLQVIYLLLISTLQMHLTMQWQFPLVWFCIIAKPQVQNSKLAGSSLSQVNKAIRHDHYSLISHVLFCFWNPILLFILLNFHCVYSFCVQFFSPELQVSSIWSCFLGQQLCSLVFSLVHLYLCVFQLFSSLILFVSVCKAVQFCFMLI